MSAYYTEQEAADKAQISEDELRLYRAHGLLPFTHEEGQVLYRTAEVDNLARALRLPGLAWAKVHELEQRVLELEHEAALRTRYSTHPRRPAASLNEMEARRSTYAAETPPWSAEQILAAASHALRTSVEEARRAREGFGEDEALQEVSSRLQRMEDYLRKDLGADFSGLYEILGDAQVHLEAVLTRSRR